MDTNQKIIKRKDVSWLQDKTNWTKFESPFQFIQAADCQFGMIDNYIKKKSNPGWDEEIILTEKLVEQINSMKPRPKFMVICGDLCDAFPGKTMRRDQVKDFKRIFGKLNPDIELICVCGNHDIGNKPTMDGLKEYKSDFGPDYFYFVLEGCLFIVINSQFYEHRDFMNDYANQHDQWLQQVLKECKNFKYSIIFQHIPWFLKHQNEEDEYFNINKSIRMDWLQRFYEAGVTKIMCGHYHQNAGGWYNNTLEEIVTCAIGATLGNDKSGYRMVNVGFDKIQHRYFEIDESPTEIDQIDYSIRLINATE